jgi:dipeptidyl-peptidase-4
MANSQFLDSDVPWWLVWFLAPPTETAPLSRFELGLLTIDDISSNSIVVSNNQMAVIRLISFLTLSAFCIGFLRSPRCPACTLLPSSGSGTVSKVVWSPDEKAVEFDADGKRYRFDLQTQQKLEIETSENDDSNAAATRSRFRGGRPANDLGNTGKYLGRPSRGRQYTTVESPDGKWLAKYQDWNLILENKESSETIPVTTDGNEKIHYGTASWVYGEELDQNKAIWWTPDSRKVLYYKFDDSNVEKFYLLRGWSEINTELYPEYYAKAGARNPVAELFIYDLETKKSTRVDVGGSGDEYIYGIRVSPLGDVMMLNWTDRLQQNLKVMTIDLETGHCTTIIEESQITWQTNSPRMTFLKDQKRFLWPTDKSGFTHYEIRDLNGQTLQTITQGPFQISSFEVMEDDGIMSFIANSSSANPYYLQYHLVGLDGTKQTRVTTLDYHHSNFHLSPNRKWLIAQYEEVNRPPCTALYKTDGTFVANLAQSDVSSAANLAEMFSFKSDDGQFDIYGILYKPKDFDPQKKYPLINALYGGPGSREIRPNYVSRTRPECDRGYLVVKVNNRGTGGRGKSFLGAAYLRLGDVDIQDHADAVRLLRQRPYVDGDRVGIVGHSYGGFMAAVGVFKHPDVYAAAVVRAGVTDWRNYDTIYTERYMSTPQLNPDGYKTGAAMTYVDDFQGKVLIMHGMLDDNVHPNNAFQLIEALDKAGKSYESRFWPNAGHGLGRGSSTTQNEFFDRILRPGLELTDSITSTPDKVLKSDAQTAADANDSILESSDGLIIEVPMDASSPDHHRTKGYRQASRRTHFRRT